MLNHKRFKDAEKLRLKWVEFCFTNSRSCKRCPCAGSEASCYAVWLFLNNDETITPKGIEEAKKVWDEHKYDITHKNYTTIPGFFEWFVDRKTMESPKKTKKGTVTE
jgi:hypothetical protein